MLNVSTSYKSLFFQSKMSCFQFLYLKFLSKGQRHVICVYMCMKNGFIIWFTRVSLAIALKSLIVPWIKKPTVWGNHRCAVCPANSGAPDSLVWARNNSAQGLQVQTPFKWAGNNSHPFHWSAFRWSFHWSFQFSEKEENMRTGFPLFQFLPFQLLLLLPLPSISSGCSNDRRCLDLLFYLLYFFPSEGLPKCVPHGLAIAHQRLGALGWTSTVLKHALLAALVNAR